MKAEVGLAEHRGAYYAERKAMLHHSIVLGLATLFLGMAAVPGGQGEELKRYSFSEPHMGTLFSLVLYAPSDAKAKAAAKAAFARIAQLDNIMSDYKSASELMQLCQKAGQDIKVSADLFAVLSEAEKMAKLTDGAFDISISPVVKLWRKARKTGKLPEKKEIQDALARVDFRKILLDPTMRTVRLQLMGMLLDLGGIAKGYAADAVHEVLRRHGIRHALIAAGGDIVVSNAPPGKKGWVVGVAPLKNPSGPPSHYLSLVNQAVSTSGDSHQAVVIDGKRYSHIVDPKTGVGLIGRRSVTVIAPRGIITDPLATAACILGEEKGLKLIENLPDTAALFVFETPDGIRTTPSKHFGKYEVKE